jgi:hypothetical protein
MLYANGKSIFEKGQEQFKEIYEQTLERLKEANESKNGFAVVFKVKPSRIIAQPTDQGFDVHTTADDFINFTKLVDEKDSQGITRKVQWIYSEEPLPKDGDTIDTSNAKKGKWFFKQDKISETISDPDLAFFLYHCHPKFGEAKNRALYQLVDRKHEAKTHVSKRQGEVEFQYVLYGENSPLQQDDSKLRIVARAWDVKNVGDKDKEILLQELEAAVQKGETYKKNGNKNSRGIAEFLEDTKLGEITKVMSYIKMAQEQEIIGINDYQPDRMGVYWLDGAGGFAGKILGLTPRSKHNWVAKTAEYLLNPNNVGILNAIKTELGIATQEEQENAGEPIDPQEILDNFFEDEYKSTVSNICKNYGIRVTGRKKELWMQDLIDIWKKDPQFSDAVDYSQYEK